MLNQWKYLALIASNALANGSNKSYFGPINLDVPNLRNDYLDDEVEMQTFGRLDWQKGSIGV